jgi:hypothetical protein
VVVSGRNVRIVIQKLGWKAAIAWCIVLLLTWYVRLEKRWHWDSARGGDVEGNLVGERSQIPTEVFQTLSSCSSFFFFLLHFTLHLISYKLP